MTLSARHVRLLRYIFEAQLLDVVEPSYDPPWPRRVTMRGVVMDR